MIERLQQFWQSLVQSPAWQSVFSHLQWIDWMVLFALLYGFFGGLKKGLPRAFAECVTVAAALIITQEFYTLAAAYLKTYLDFLSEEMLNVTSYVALAFAMMMVLRILFWGILFLMPAAEASVVESGLAVVFNTASKLLLLALVSQIILIGPWGHLKLVFGQGDSYTGYALVQLTHRLDAVMQGPLHTLRGILPL